jgi:hypothetical protein
MSRYDGCWSRVFVTAAHLHFTEMSTSHHDLTNLFVQVQIRSPQLCIDRRLEASKLNSSPPMNSNSTQIPTSTTPHPAPINHPS